MKIETDDGEARSLKQRTSGQGIPEEGHLERLDFFY
jgi:hypothetical protein